MIPPRFTNQIIDAAWVRSWVHLGEEDVFGLGAVDEPVFFADGELPRPKSFFVEHSPFGNHPQHNALLPGSSGVLGGGVPIGKLLGSFKPLKSAFVPFFFFFSRHAPPRKSCFPSSSSLVQLIFF